MANNRRWFNEIRVVKDNGRKLYNEKEKQYCQRFFKELFAPENYKSVVNGNWSKLFQTR